MNDWLARILHSRANIEENQEKLAQLQRIAIALAQDISLTQMAELVTVECRRALRCDAICTYLLKPDGVFEMIAERGCTPEFMERYRFVPNESVPHANAHRQDEALFVGDAEEFTRELPQTADLVRKSGRETIGYSVLIVNGSPIGLLGFSYNTKQIQPVDKGFILALLNVCGQALERVRLSEDEKRAKHAAEEANRAKTEFLANVSHEIRTPLGLIQGYTDLLFESDGLTPEQKHWAEIVRRNTRQLTHIIGEVLDISKIEAEKIEIDQVRFSLTDLIEDVRTTAELKAQEKNLALRFMTENLPDQIVSDPTRLRQIMLNLIGNAIKFTSKGGVEVFIRLTPSSRLEVLVKDSGIGIAQEHHKLIFKPFTQADASTRRRFGGTGLGLAISKQVAEAMGGDLSLVGSAPGEGSVFRFAMNCCVQEPSRPARENGHSIPTGLELSGVSILLVEDSADNRELFHHILSHQGARVDVAANAEAGIDQALRHPYDVVLMDIQMPELDGHEAVTILRQKGYAQPIAALTAHALSSERERSLREGFDEYLTKPVDPPVLIGVVKRLARAL